MRRELGAFESALTLSDAHAPLNVVAVLRLATGPTPEALRLALDALQQRHPLLRTRIAAAGGRYFFDRRNVGPIALRRAHRTDGETWIGEAEAELDDPLDAAAGPLMRCVYLDSEAGACEILITFHHAIMDAASAVSLCRELLAACAEIETVGAAAAVDARGTLPAAEDLFPPAFQGWRRRLGVGRFLLRQLRDEAIDRWRAGGRWHPPATGATRNRILSFQLSEAETRALVRRSRRLRLTLHSVFDAAILLALARQRYSESLPLRHLVFADLRPYLVPPVSPQDLGAYFAMLRLTTAMRPDRDLWRLAAEINGDVHAASKRGAKYLFSLTSASVMRFLIRRGSDRMAATAISYAGAVRFDSEGPYPVEGLHAFVSNFRLGPEYTAQVRHFAGRLWWDILYLDPELDPPAARRIADQIHALLTEEGGSS